MRSHARHSLREVGEVWSRRGAVLRQLIDDRAHGKQRLLHAEALLVAEDVGQFGEGKRRTLAQVVKSHIDLVRRLDEAQHVLLRLQAEPSCFLRELVQVLPACPCVNLLELLVQFLHLLGCHARELADRSHFSVNVRIDLHSGFACHDDTGHGGSRAHDTHLPVVEHPIETLPFRFRERKFPIDFSQFLFDQSDFSGVCVPRLTASFHVIQLPI